MLKKQEIVDTMLSGTCAMMKGTLGMMAKAKGTGSKRSLRVYH